jgi:putative DNA primase/helicase
MMQHILKENLSEPEVFIDHIKDLKKQAQAIEHSLVLNALVEQIEPVDFEKIVLSEVENQEKAKVTLRHLIILSVECTLKTAQTNRWNLCKNEDYIYAYNGEYWGEIDKENFQRFLGVAAEKMGLDKFTARYFSIREKLFKQFQSTAYLPKPESDPNSVLINLLNGTFEIKYGVSKLRPFCSDDFLTYQLPFKYDPNAQAPLFFKYLNRVLPDNERQNLLSEYIGYIFIKHGSKQLKEEKALILYGTGANGKSVFFEIINALLGAENVSNYSLQSITNDNGYYRAKLANKLLNYSSEISVHLNTTYFKQMVSGEPIEARLPYGNPMTLTQYAKFIFNCNELPKDVEHTDAFFRRFLIIPFDERIPQNEQDKNLHSKIIETELSGIFNWVLSGLSRLLSQKRFSECSAAMNALKKYKEESDTIQMYLNEYSFRVSATTFEPLKKMFKDYQSYCIDYGFKCCSLRTFADRLRNIGYDIIRKNYGMAVNAEKHS